jgi:hypothetical protein
MLIAHYAQIETMINRQSNKQKTKLSLSSKLEHSFDDNNTLWISV